jgi:hypothetical protein
VVSWVARIAPAPNLIPLSDTGCPKLGPFGSISRLNEKSKSATFCLWGLTIPKESSQVRKCSANYGSEGFRFNS